MSVESMAGNVIPSWIAGVRRAGTAHGADVGRRAPVSCPRIQGDGGLSRHAAAPPDGPECFPREARLPAMLLPCILGASVAIAVWALTGWNAGW